MLFQLYKILINKCNLSHDLAFGSDITPCNNIDKPLEVYQSTGNVMQ